MPKIKSKCALTFTSYVFVTLSGLKMNDTSLFACKSLNCTHCTALQQCFLCIRAPPPCMFMLSMDCSILNTDCTFTSAMPF